MQIVWVKHLKIYLHWQDEGTDVKVACLMLHVSPSLDGGIESTVIISKEKADLDGTRSMLEEKSRAQNYVEKLAGKPGKKQMKYNYKSENTMRGQEECKNM